jgi:hypothetical protein
MEKRMILVAVLMTVALALAPIASSAAMVTEQYGVMTRADGYEPGALPTEVPGIQPEAVHDPFWSGWTKGCSFDVKENPEWEERMTSRIDTYEAGAMPTEPAGGVTPHFLAYVCAE